MVEGIEEILSDEFISFFINPILDIDPYSDTSRQQIKELLDDLLEYQVDRLKEIIDKNDQVSGSYAMGTLNQIINKYEGIKKGQSI